jgi:AmmeMemoRadiSam system protein B/AmmeMemoRadiSam system protein A
MSTAEPLVAESPPAKPQQLKLSEHEKQLILATARELVHAAVAGRVAELPDPTIGGTAERIVSGAFVTLKRKGHLRGCCGLLGQPVALARALEEASYKTVWEDVRFPPISSVELDYLDLEVWVLANPEPSSSRGEERVREVTIGKHGLVIERGQSRGLLLPGVAVENGWDAQRFLEQTCAKAGIHPSLWKDDETALFTFEGESIRGHVKRVEGGGEGDRRPSWFSAEELAVYAEFCRRNICALAVGATPNYYVHGVSDGTVSGIVLTVHIPSNSRAHHFTKISLRPGLPLQATLFNLTQSAAHSLAHQGLKLEDLNQLTVHAAILHDAALHGTVADCDLGGVDPRRRGILVFERSKVGFFFDAERSPEDVVRIAAEQAHVRRPRSASVFSAETMTSQSPVAITTAPKPVRGPAVRNPAVAGRFYPADPDELSRLVDDLMGAPVPAETWSAAMIPHAGLIFSGRIAASVLKRIRIPRTVIVVGPKHTPYGMDWAIAPQQAWAMPGFTVESDLKLVRQMTQAIPGLELDSLAHKQEHAIEVELPFISRLAPEARVLGIAIGGDTDYADCVRFAEGFANVLRESDERPLLLISSDMNHFATDRETRRLDEMAIAALEGLDPHDVYDTVTKHGISMCGVLPAVIVLETLRLLSGVKRAEREGYATTADVTGDPTRVVGYAGMLFG